MEPYEFSTDWFTKHLVVWNEIFKDHQPSRILEIGSFEGRATCWLIETCAKNHPMEIFCVDTWQGGVEHAGMDFSVIEERFKRNIEKAVHNQPHQAAAIQVKATSLVGLSTIAAKGIKDFGLVYIDGSHRASDVFFDAAMAFQLCAVNGLMIFDDYYTQHDKEKDFDYPQIAIDAFMKVHENKLKPITINTFDDEGKDITSITHTYQKYLIKTAE